MQGQTTECTHESRRTRNPMLGVATPLPVHLMKGREDSPYICGPASHSRARALSSRDVISVERVELRKSWPRVERGGIACGIAASGDEDGLIRARWCELASGPSCLSQPPSGVT